MQIKRVLSIHDRNETQLGVNQTQSLTPDERISLLEELRYDLGKLTGHDYSKGIARVVSVIERPE